MGSPLLELREICDELRRRDIRRRDLVDKRNHLIQVAAARGETQEEIARVAGLSQSRVHEIIASR